MDTLLLLLLIPLSIPLIFKYFCHTTITWKEWAVQSLIVIVCVSAMYQIGIYNKTTDTEVWNGQVTGKEKKRVSCEHSYSCNCVSYPCGKSTCTTCQTYYDHSYDNDWRVYTNIGNFNINRLDSQGLKLPPRWTVVQKGQPVSDTHRFENFIKATPHSLFNAATANKDKFVKLIPEYPSKIYDYQYIDRVFAMGVNVPIQKKLNHELAMILRQLGPNKQANAIVVIVGTGDQSYIHALESAWLGGKKNDVVVIIGTTNYPDIAWVEIMSWTKEELFKVQLRDAIYDLKKIDTSVIKTMDEHIGRSFVRRPWKDFDYLEKDVEPSVKVLFIILFINILISCGITYWFHRKDVFGDEGHGRRRYR